MAPGTGLLTLSFKIPSFTTTAASKARAPMYISPSTSSVTVGVDAGNAAAATANCASGTCTVTLDLAPGSHTLAIRLYDAANGGGNELASNTAATCAVTLGTANTCAITMYGLATSLAMTSTSANVSGSQGAGFTFVNGSSTPFTIAALDADGNQILGAGAVTPAVSSAGSGVTIATPAPSASPIYNITDTNQTTQTVALSATPAPNSDGSPLSTNVSVTGASLYAGSLYFFSGSDFYVVSATTGQTVLSITNPVNGMPMAAATDNYALLNASGDADLYIYSLATDAITSTIATGCTSSDNVPIAADNGTFYYDCGGHIYAYNTAGTQVATWADTHGSSGYVAAGGGYVYTINGTTIYVFNSSGVSQGTFTIAAAPSPGWAFAASPQGLFVASGTTARLYSPAGSLVTSFTIGTAECDIQPVGSYLTVRTASTQFTTYSISTGHQVGQITTAVTPNDCRVGFSN